MTVREENREDRSAIHVVHEAAFGGAEEADLVDKLRDEGDALLSLVAEVDRSVVGHVLFSRMWIEMAGEAVEAVALAPVAVLPAHQNRGVGGELVRHGLDLLRARGERIVIVLGHPAYYPRFGFSSEKARALDSPFPGDSFMAMELVDGALGGVRGVVRYPTAFGL